MRLLLLALLTSPLIVLGSESFPEPFGLQWGMSETSLKQLGFAEVDHSGGLTVWTSVSAPKAWSRGDMYVAITYDGRLVKASATSTNFTDDIYGTKGKKAYEQITALLTKKYGTPTNQYERIGGKLYDEADEFYQCLEYSGCGSYFSMYEFGGGVIAVQIKGTRRGEGYLTISYEGPEFSGAKREIEQENLESDADVF